MSSYFIIPKLQSNGRLLPQDGQEVYKHYLSQEKMDYNKQIRRPCRSAVLNAMIKTHNRQTTDASAYVEKHLQDGGKIFFWSDQHFYHNNIIEYSKRPFENVEHMNNTMLKNYYNQITQEDLVIFGGDVAFGDIEKSKSILANLPGKKLLVLGNHDFEKNQMLFRDYKIFDVVTMSFVFYWTFGAKVANILVTHYPIDNKWLPENTINIHGHIHQYKADKKNINMAVEHMQYSPQKLGEQIKEVFLTYC